MENRIPANHRFGYDFRNNVKIAIRCSEAMHHTQHKRLCDLISLYDVERERSAKKKITQKSPDSIGYFARLKGFKAHRKYRSSYFSPQAQTRNRDPLARPFAQTLHAHNSHAAFPRFQDGPYTTSRSNLQTQVRTEEAAGSPEKRKQQRSLAPITVSPPPAAS